MSMTAGQVRRAMRELEDFSRRHGREHPQVWLLYVLYPCTSWSEIYNPHGATAECDCEEFLEGVFKTPIKAKHYIAEYLNEEHCHLSWRPLYPQRSTIMIAAATTRENSCYYKLERHDLD